MTGQEKCLERTFLYITCDTYTRNWWVADSQRSSMVRSGTTLKSYAGRRYTKENLPPWLSRRLHALLLSIYLSTGLALQQRMPNWYTWTNFKNVLGAAPISLKIHMQDQKKPSRWDSSRIPVLELCLASHPWLKRAQQMISEEENVWSTGMPSCDFTEMNLSVLNPCDGGGKDKRVSMFLNVFELDDLQPTYLGAQDQDRL